MGWTSGFFNSLNADRVYNADQLSSIFEGLITDGVYEAVGNKLAVQPNGGMTIRIASGRGWFNKRWVNNDSPYLLTVEASDVLLNRYAAVVVRADNSTGVRSVTPYLKYSQFASAPVKPTMEVSDTVKEYCLAYIYIKAGVSSITASAIEDTRADNTLCGWVTGLIDQIDSATLFDQFTDIFNTWFSGLQDIIDDNVETTLVSALPASLTLTLTSARWTQSGGVWVQSININGMTATKSVIVQPNNDTVTYYTNNGVYCSSQRAGQLVFSASSKPAVNVKVDVMYMGV